MAGAFPIAEQVGAAQDSDLLHGAEVFEVGNRERVGGAAFEPLGGVNSVARFAPAQERVEAVSPIAVVDEADRHGATHA